MGGKQRKVAYAVFRGRIPGVYRTYAEAETQVNGFSHCEFRGYTRDDGGYDAAFKAFEDYSNKQDQPIKQLQTPPASQSLKKKERPASWQAEKNAPSKSQRIGNTEGSSRAQPRRYREKADRSNPGGRCVSSASSAPDIDEADISSEDTAPEDSSNSSEESTSEEDEKVQEHKGSPGSVRYDCLGEDDISESGSNSTPSATSSHNDAISDQSTEAGRNGSPDVKQLTDRRHEGSSISDGNTEVAHLAHGQENSTSQIQQDTPEPFWQRQNITNRHLASYDKDQEKASSSSTDYGDFPSDLGLLSSPQDQPVKAEPGGYREEKYVERTKDLKLRSPLPFSRPKTEPELCDEQKDLVNLILGGNNVFYTGSAGCGKSTVLRSFVRELEARRRHVHIVAYTGRAALVAGGRTLHTYAGWTPSSMAKPINKLKREAHGKKNWKRFNSTDVLVIDEISMIENHLFERLNRILKDSRDNDEPFGGVQLIVTGDFCQLPPVKPFRHCMECGGELFWIRYLKQYKCRKAKCKDSGVGLHDSDKWAFRSDAWKECGFKHVNLTKVHRQNDTRFIHLLEKCRYGYALTEDDMEIVRSKPKKFELLMKGETKEELEDDSDLTGHAPLAVKMFPRRDDVMAENESRLALIEVECLEFNCYDKLDWNPEHHDLEKFFEPGLYPNTLKALDEHSFEAKLELKQGMPVILLVNLDFDAGLINGSQGTLIGFEDHDFKNFPELLGDHVIRRTTLVNIFAARADFKRWPIVRFPDAGNQERTIYPYCMVNELGDGGENDDEYSLLSRTQIPLLAAWAITIHRSQGMTLTRAEVNLSRAFEQSQRYVALSRVRDPEGLTVTDWGICNIGADYSVMGFLEEKGLLDTKLLKSTEGTIRKA